jgi:hypothetical protein
MFGLEYMTVGGYSTEGGILCRECGERQRLPLRDAVSVAQLRDDWPEGLWCGECLAEIVSPEEEEE